MARSPNYPSIGLAKAIELAKQVYAQEVTAKADPEVVAKAIGYSGLNGASITAISTMKKYGLLEEVGTQLKISRDGLTILVDPSDSKDRADAIRKAASSPALFKAIQKHYGEDMPSDENLRAFLLKSNFTPSAVDAPIRAYRETMGLVNSLKAGDTAKGDNSQSEVEEEVSFEQAGTVSLEQIAKGITTTEQILGPEGLITVRFASYPTWEVLDFLENYIKLRKSIAKKPGAHEGKKEEKDASSAKP